MKIYFSLGLIPLLFFLSSTSQAQQYECRAGDLVYYSSIPCQNVPAPPGKPESPEVGVGRPCPSGTDWFREAKRLSDRIINEQWPKYKTMADMVVIDLKSLLFREAAQRVQERGREFEVYLPQQAALLRCAVENAETDPSLSRRAIWVEAARSSKRSWEILQAEALRFFYIAGRLYYLAGESQEATRLYREVVAAGARTKVAPDLVEYARFALEDIKEERSQERREKVLKEITVLLETAIPKLKE